MIGLGPAETGSQNPPRKGLLVSFAGDLHAVIQADNPRSRGGSTIGSLLAIGPLLAGGIGCGLPAPA